MKNLILKLWKWYKSQNRPGFLKLVSGHLWTMSSKGAIWEGGMSNQGATGGDEIIIRNPTLYILKLLIRAKHKSFKVLD